MVFAVLGLRDNAAAHHIHQLKFDKLGGTKIVFEQVLWKSKFGRIRDVAEGPDGFLYFPTGGDSGSTESDKILRARPR